MPRPLPPAMVSALALATLLLLPSTLAAAKPAKLIYVWAGAADTTSAQDTLFVFSAEKANFGSLIRAVPTPYAGLEPHHCSISADGKTLGAGGLLAVLSGLPSVVFFSLANPTKPTLLPTPIQPPTSAITDEFEPIPGGGFLITMMGSSNGGSPGRVAKYDANLNFVAEYPTDVTTVTDPNPGFNPHGMGVDWQRGTMVTSDFIEPSSTLASAPVPPGVIGRTTVRTWTLNAQGDWVIKAVLNAAGIANIPLGAQQEGGMMDAELIGSTGLYYVSGGAGYLYVVDPGQGSAPSTINLAYDIGDAYRPASHMLMKSFRSGTRMVVTTFGSSSVQLLDTTNPLVPVLLSSIAFTATGTTSAPPTTPTGVGAHYITVSADERLIAVSTYFLDEGSAGVVHAGGDRTVRFLTLDSGATTLASQPSVPIIDMKALLPGTGGFKPHCVQLA